MAIVRAKGKNADYIIEFGRHFDQVNPRTNDHKEADAYIVEGALTLDPNALKNPRLKGRNLEKVFALTAYDEIISAYPELVSEAKKGKKSVWSVDVSPKSNLLDVKEMLIENIPVWVFAATATTLISRKIKREGKLPRRKFLSMMKISALGVASYALTPIGTASLMGELKKGELPKWMSSYGITMSDLVKGVTTECRSAITAHKAEEFVAPYLSKKLGKRPTIYIWMGAAHITLSKLLEIPGYRQDVLRGFHPIGRLFPNQIPGHSSLRACREYDFSKMRIYANGKHYPRIRSHVNTVSFPRPMPKTNRATSPRRTSERTSRRAFLSGRHRSA